MRYRMLSSQPVIERFRMKRQNQAVISYLVSKTETSDDLKKCTSEPHALMCSVHLRETQQRAVFLKNSW